MLDEQHYSEQAEQSVLGALMIKPESIDLITQLEERNFYNEDHRLIFRAIKKISETIPTWDLIVVAEFLEKYKKLDQVGGLSFLGAITSATPSAANIVHYASIVRENAIRRDLKAVSADLIEMLDKPDDIPAILDRAQSMLLSIGSNVDVDEPRLIDSIIADQMDIIGRRMERDLSGIVSTGLTDLDDILNGGLRNGQVIVLAGRPSMGKSALSMTIALNVALENMPTLYLSMEMTESDLADRALAAIGGIDISNLIAGELNSNDWDGLSVATNKLKSVPFYVLDKAGLDYFRLATIARRFKRKHGIKLLVVDYLQLMSGDDSKKRHAQIEDISRSIKVLAKELNIPIILLAQLNRQAERMPKLAHLRDSGAIEQDADVVLFVHREEVDNPETQYKGYADIHIAKQRQGRLGRIGATYIGKYCKFCNFSGQMPDYANENQRRHKQYD